MVSASLSFVSAPRKPIKVHSISPGLVVDAGLAKDREERLGLISQVYLEDIVQCQPNGLVAILVEVVNVILFGCKGFGLLQPAYPSNEKAFDIF